ncbi:hypothetical protein ACFYYY_13810 [Streptomyces sp. NPDC001834]|uniref:hypothetical protein n=1 Tax=unclassified Streptomyces TaxID=2593676 RepID=UPI003419517E
MHGDRPPRRTAAVLAGLSCLLLPLLGQVPRASAGAAAGDPGGGPDSAAATAAAPYAYPGRANPRKPTDVMAATGGSGTDADACDGVSRTPHEFTRIVVQYQG